MCDLFDQFLKFQKKAREPVHFSQVQRFIGGISWHDVHVTTKVSCRQNLDGSVQLDVKYFEKKWFLRGRAILQLPIETQTVIVTQEQFKKHWKFGAPSETHRRLTTNDEIWNAVTFTNCGTDNKKCYFFMLQLKEDD